MMKKRISILLALGLTITTMMAGCGSAGATETKVTTQSTASSNETTVEEESTGIVWDDEITDYTGKVIEQDSNTADQSDAAQGGIESTSTAGLDTNDLFTDRDLRQEADTTDAKTITVADGQDIEITEEGVYIISGTASECTIRVEAPDDAKVQIVLDGVNVSNSDSPVIYVVSADKVFVTTTNSTNTLSVKGTFTADGDTNTDAVIFSKDDLVLNGVGTLTIASSANGISCKDDLKVTGGTYNITSTDDAIEANDSISVSDGTFTIKAGKDGLHSEYDEDSAVGSIYISGGTLNIASEGDSIQATTILQIDGGTLTLSGTECLEATYVLINDGTINIEASDDGINASNKSTAYSPTIDINGGDITIVMGSGDTDAIDSNGSIYINGGTIDITAQSAFDYDQTGQINGGTVIVNGQQITQMTNSMMGGGMMGGMMGGSGGGPSAGGSYGGQSGSSMNGSQGGGPSGGMNGGMGGRP